MNEAGSRGLRGAPGWGWAALLFVSCCAHGAELALGPMLGGVTDSYAGIWGQTDAPAEVAVTLLEEDSDSEPATQTFRTSPEGGHSFTARFEGLKADTTYRYQVTVDGEEAFKAEFATPGASWEERPVRILYGSGWHPKDRITGRPSVFTRMAERDADAIIFNGDFPYTKRGRLDELRARHRQIREVEGFRELTCATATYAIYDDHDFGPNDCDGTHPYAEQALAGFKEHWPNYSYGLPDAPGCFGRFTLGTVEVFLIDSRYHRRAVRYNAQMLGEKQFAWLCDGLEASTARYKLLMSSVQWGRVKSDSWNHPKFHQAERDRIFAFIADNKIPGVVLASGDVHRCEVWKLDIGDGRCLYDLTSSGLARKSFPIKERYRPPPMVHTHAENGMYAELEFRPPSDTETAFVYRIWSVANGLIYEIGLSPKDLILQ